MPFAHAGIKAKTSRLRRALTPASLRAEGLACRTANAVLAGRTDINGGSMTSVAAERVRKFRKIRKEAGLVELRIWVAKEDKEAALDAVQEFVKEGLWQSVCHQMYGADWRKHPEKFRNIASATGHPKIRDENGC